MSKEMACFIYSKTLDIMDCKYMTNVMFKRSCLLQADFEGIKNEQHIFTETRDPLNSTINVIHW